MKYPALFLMGPTAAGKSDFAIELADHLPIEIISVDSAMVYRGMEIGTGKPSAVEQLAVPHHLMDIRDPSIAYSAAEFAKDALSLMQAITQRGRIPVLVGGTMLYFRALQHGLSPLPAADPLVRAALLTEANRVGWAAMHQKLGTIDPSSALRIHPNDPQRIQRALEVYEITQKPLSSFFSASGPVLPGAEDSAALLIEDYHIHSFALGALDRAALHQRIEQRFHQMLAQGFVAEVEALLARGDLNPELPALRSVGYRQIIAYLTGGCGFDEMVYQSIVATRQLAKRQLTWLRSLSEVIWLLNNRVASLETVLHYFAQPRE